MPASTVMTGPQLVKAGYFYLRRVFSPILASFRSGEDGGVELWVTNDTLQALDDNLTVRLASFSGAVTWQEAVPVSLPPQQSRRVAAWDADRLRPGPDRHLAVRSAEGRFPANRHFFAAIKDLDRPTAAPAMTVSQESSHQLTVELRGTDAVYCLLVHLLVPHEATRYSGNYVDLGPGEVRVLHVTNSDVELAPEMVTLGWR
jgi:beta-mannosidase